MAAGKLSLSRRVDLSHVSKRGSDFCFGDNIRSESSYETKRGDFGGFNIRVDEYMDFDEEVVLSPPQKRRKFSPVVRDVKVNTKVTMTSLPKQSPLERRSSLTYESDLDYDQEPGQLDEEDFSRAPNISTSRWAVDDDLEEDEGKGKGGCGLNGEEAKRRSSSPESGVTQKECSGRSSDSIGGCVPQYYGGVEFSDSELENDEFMEVDRSDHEGDVRNRSGSDSDDDEYKPGAPGLGRRNMLQACRSVFEYEMLGKINEGSYGIVFKARNKKNGEMVALKKMKLIDGKQGFPVYYLREINTQLSLNHPSIVNVREVVVDDSLDDGFNNIFLVMDYVEHDLKALMQSRKQSFSQSEVKCLMIQLLEGVKYLHDNWVLHRDLKSSNLLLNNKGELKICDFGMARQYGSPLKPYTALVVTLWYRAPELLLGAKEYSTAVDMWSVGCIMAEFLLNKPLFDGKTELEQVNKIFKMLGTANNKIWPGFSHLPGAKANFAHQPNNLLHKKFPPASFTGSPMLSDLGLDLLSRLLTYDPDKRITADEALNHRWFQQVPLPKSKEFMPTFPAEKILEFGQLMHWTGRELAMFIVTCCALNDALVKQIMKAAD